MTELGEFELKLQKNGLILSSEGFVSRMRENKNFLNVANRSNYGYIMKEEKIW